MQIFLDAWSNTRADEVVASRSYTSKTEAELEYNLGSASVFSCSQRALDCIFGAMHVGVYDQCVIVPVNAPIWVVYSIIMAGGHPIILDIDPMTHQYSLNLLDEAIKEIETAFVILWRPLSNPNLDPHILELTKDLFTIVVTPFMPLGENLFNHVVIYDLEPASIGAVAYIKNKDVHTAVKNAKNRLGDHLTSFYSELVIQRLFYNSSLDYITTSTNHFSLYKNICDSYAIPYINTTFKRYFIIPIDDAATTVATLHLHEIQAKVGMQGLNHEPTLQERYKFPLDYTNGDKLHNKVLYLPCHPGLTANTIKFITTKVLECLPKTK